MAAELMLILSAPASKRRGIVERAHSASNREGNKKLSRSAPNRFQQGRALFVGRGDIQEHNFICPSLAVGRG